MAAAKFTPPQAKTFLARVLSDELSQPVRPQDIHFRRDSRFGLVADVQMVWATTGSEVAYTRYKANQLIGDWLRQAINRFGSEPRTKIAITRNGRRFDPNTIASFDHILIRGMTTMELSRVLAAMTPAEKPAQQMSLALL